MKTTSFYVHRHSPAEVLNSTEGWVGPIRSAKQAERERAAWADAGWTAEVHASSVEVKRQVREWMEAVAARRQTA